MSSYHENVKEWDNGEIGRLIEKGFLKEVPPEEEIKHRKTGGSPRYFPDYMEVTAKFADAVMATKSRFDEFWEAYPAQFVRCDNPAHNLPLKAVDKKEIEELYFKRVRTRTEHDDVMTAIRWAVSQCRVNMDIKSYVAGENWRSDLEEMERSSKGGESPE